MNSAIKTIDILFIVLVCIPNNVLVIVYEIDSYISQKVLRGFVMFKYIKNHQYFNINKYTTLFEYIY